MRIASTCMYFSENNSNAPRRWKCRSAGSPLPLTPSSIMPSPAMGDPVSFSCLRKGAPQKKQAERERRVHATRHCLWHCSPGHSQTEQGTDYAKGRSGMEQEHMGLAEGGRGLGDIEGGGTTRHAGRGSYEGGQNKTIWDAFLNVPYCPPSLHAILRRRSQSCPLEIPATRGLGPSPKDPAISPAPPVSWMQTSDEVGEDPCHHRC